MTRKKKKCPEEEPQVFSLEKSIACRDMYLGNMGKTLKHLLYCTTCKFILSGHLFFKE